MIRLRRASKRIAAPENVNATSSPSRAKTAPSTAPSPARTPSGSRASRCAASRRPTSKRTTMPIASAIEKSAAMVIRAVGCAPSARSRMLHQVLNSCNQYRLPSFGGRRAGLHRRRSRRGSRLFVSDQCESIGSQLQLGQQTQVARENVHADHSSQEIAHDFEDEVVLLDD